MTADQQVVNTTGDESMHEYCDSHRRAFVIFDIRTL